MEKEVSMTQKSRVTCLRRSREPTKRSLRGMNSTKSNFWRKRTGYMKDRGCGDGVCFHLEQKPENVN